MMVKHVGVIALLILSGCGGAPIQNNAASVEGNSTVAAENIVVPGNTALPMTESSVHGCMLSCKSAANAAWQKCRAAVPEEPHTQSKDKDGLAKCDDARDSAIAECPSNCSNP